MLEKGCQARGVAWCSGLSGGGGAEKGSGMGILGPMEMLTYEVTAAERKGLSQGCESKQSVLDRI